MAVDLQQSIDRVLASKTERAKRGHQEAAVAFVTYDGAAADLNELASYVNRLEIELLRIKRTCGVGEVDRG